MKRPIQRMRKHSLMRTNICITILVIVGFLLIHVVSYSLNSEALEEDIEHVALLTSESIYHQIEATFAEPVNVSLTMANDTLLKRLLWEEEKELEPAYLERMRGYLAAYRERYNYDSVFLVSVRTGRYYHFRGLDRVLTEENPENDWYFSFLRGTSEYDLNIDNDEASEDVITVFVNCKISEPDGAVLGVVGVGLRVEHLQGLLQSYANRFDSHLWLIDPNGQIQLSSIAKSGGRNLFDNPAYGQCREDMLAERKDQVAHWNSGPAKENFLVAQYIPALNWHLVVANSTDDLNYQFEWQFLAGFLITIVILTLLLVLVNNIISKYNKRLLKLTVSQELEYEQLLRQATEGLYENVFEMDLTNDRAVGKAIRAYFESLGLSPDVPYSQGLRVIAEKQVRPDFREAYLATFSPEHAMEAFEKGQTELQEDLMVTNDGENYYWLRIRARIFYWSSDESLRMITYRQNVDAEKRREAQMMEMAQQDAMTGLYNKSATELRIVEVIEHSLSDAQHALIMFDIDRFKNINDTLGHATGDLVIKEIAQKLKSRFRLTDVCGRIGGDEFMVFLSNIPDQIWLERQAAALVKEMHKEIGSEGKKCSVSISMGIALYPEAGEDFVTLYRKADAALYMSKKNGRNQYILYSKPK